MESDVGRQSSKKIKMVKKSLHEHNEKKNRIRAGVMTGIVFSVVLLLCFFLVAFTIQDPPPGEQYVAVGFADMGSVDEAGGRHGVGGSFGSGRGSHRRSNHNTHHCGACRCRRGRHTSAVRNFYSCRENQKRT